MLRRFLKSRCAWGVAGALIGMALIWAVSSSFGLTGEICAQGSSTQNGNCPRYNLLLVGLWHLVETANWLSPALTALATVAIGYFTWTLWISSDASSRLAERTAEHFRTSERPYLQMSHRDGLATAITGEVSIPMQIRNWGRTPGAILDRRLGICVWSEQNPLPPDPPYRRLVRPPIAGAFLVPTTFVNWDDFLQVSPAQMKAINNGEQFLVVFGYVDYEDKFGDRHRAGYGRQYIPAIAGPGNLVFVAVPGYNFDMPIV